MRTAVAIDPRFRNHVAPSQHPERPERLAAIERALDESGALAGLARIAARPATREELERAHTAAYLDRLERLVRGGGSGWIDEDTYYCPATWEAALAAAGAAVDLARAVRARTIDNGIALVRPPGHHATADRAMGFCLINNVAVAAAALVADGARVAIVDFDVHHGNGTQDIFYADPRVLYASTHEYPLYPGTGAASERGEGPGRGATVNVPLPPGSGDDALLAAYDDVVLPAVAAFAPDVLLLSAGFDAHERDPLASLRVTTSGYARLGRRLVEAGGGRVAAVLEGGYDLTALGESVCALVGALCGRSITLGTLGTLGTDATEATAEAPAHPLAPLERERIAVARRSLDELPPPSP